ncbi:MAG: metallophosphoesterase [Lachnospiraceae bacterium]|nr:metallophosphoesterase [Lachnospiraceae bacterium]
MKLYIRSPLEISHYKFISEKITRGVRLAVLADLHNCMCEDGGRHLFEVIDSEHPDIIIIAGDMVDGGNITTPAPAMKLVKLLHDNYPVIYGMGNHERKIFVGEKMGWSRKVLKEGLKEADLKILSDSYKILKDTGIKVSCLDLSIDYFGRVSNPTLDESQIREKLGELDENYYNIMIAHDPQYFEAYSDYGSDLVLSGHMHGGIIRFPFLGGFISPKLKLFPKYDAGLFKRKNSTMIISKGLGTHTIHVRVNNPTELVIVDLDKNNAPMDCEVDKDKGI